MTKYPRQKWNIVCVCHQKNSERWIQTMIKSVLPVTPNILIVDHLSTDNTIDKIKEIKNSRETNIKIMSYKDPEFNEKKIRKTTFDMSINLFGIPDWVIYIDGDEALSPWLQSFLISETRKPMEEIEYSILTHGWQHLYENINTQVLNRRTGQISKIWNTFKLKYEKGYVSKDQYQKLIWETITDKGPNYNFHIAQVPKDLSLYRSKRFKTRLQIAYPLDHYGFFDTEENQRRIHHHEELLKKSWKDQKYFYDKPVIFPSNYVDHIMQDIREVKDLPNLAVIGPFVRRVGEFQVSKKDSQPILDKFDSSGIPKDKKILCFGWDDGQCAKRILENHFSPENIFLFRFPNTFFYGYQEHSDLSRRQTVNFVFDLEKILPEIDYILIPNIETSLWVSLIGVNKSYLKNGVRLIKVSDEGNDFKLI